MSEMPPKLLQTLTSFAQLLTSDHDSGDLLHTLCDTAVEVTGVTGAGILVEDIDGALRYAVASDPMAGRMEDLQLSTGEGPCMLVHATGERALIADLTTETRFPAFTPQALDAGVQAIFTFPMKGAERTVGVLDLYREDPQPLPEELCGHAQLIAELAAAAVLNRRAYSEAVAEADRLQAALDSRIALEQAKGRISEQAGVDTGVAEKMIYELARRHDESVAAIVRQVGDGTLRAGDDRT